MEAEPRDIEDLGRAVDEASDERSALTVEPSTRTARGSSRSVHARTNWRADGEDPAGDLPQPRARRPPRRPRAPAGAGRHAALPRLARRPLRTAASYEALRTAVLDLCREGVQLSRFKGLGEMNSEQLWETTMDPERRILQRVTMEDEAAVGELFAKLMGDKVEPRRAFIEDNARSVRFLDV